MIIYPSDSAPVGERIQFAAGVKLKAKPAKVTADGGLGYWQLTEKVGRAGEVLFIREIDATKA